MNPWKEKRVIGNATLYLGDCLEVLHGLRDGCQNGDVSVERGGGADIALPTRTFHVDAIITDVQYGLDFDYGHPDTPEYVESVCVPAIRVAREIATRTVAFVGVHNLWEYPKADWLLSWSWRSTNHFGKCGYSMWQPALFYGVDIDSFGNVNGLTKTDCVHFPDGTGIGFLADSKREDHPCPKPEKLMRWLVQRFCEQHGTVADIMMGSGTTGVACMNLGRKFIGIEIEPKYFEIACERIENAQRQLRMFA